MAMCTRASITSTLFNTPPCYRAAAHTHVCTHPHTLHLTYPEWSLHIHKYACTHPHIHTMHTPTYICTHTSLYLNVPGSNTLPLLARLPRYWTATLSRCLAAERTCTHTPTHNNNTTLQHAYLNVPESNTFPLLARLPRYWTATLSRCLAAAPRPSSSSVKRKPCLVTVVLHP